MRYLGIIILASILVYSCRKDISDRFISDTDLKIYVEDDSLNVAISERTLLYVEIDTSLMGQSFKFDFNNASIDGKTTSFNKKIYSLADTLEYVPTNTNGTNYITVSLMDGSNEVLVKSIELHVYNNENESNQLSLTSALSSLRINRLENTTITIQLDTSVTDRAATITFDGGKINGLGSPFAISQIDPNTGIWTGTFSAVKQDTPGSKFVKVTSENGSEVTIPFQFYNESLDSVLTLNYVSTGTVADGVETFNIDANLTNHFSDSVTFTTSAGKFSNNQTSITIDFQGLTNISLPVTTTSESLDYTITASVVGSSYSRSINVTVGNALPDNFTFVPSNYNIDSSNVAQGGGDDINFTVNLYRNSGTPTKGQVFVAESYQIVGASPINNGVIYDLPLKIGTNGQASFSLFAQPNLDPSLPLYIKLNVDCSSGVVQDSLSINVLDGAGN